MTHIERNNFVKECIKKISSTFIKNSDIYFCESDLQSELFALLLKKFNKETELRNTHMWGTDRPKKLKKVSTRRLHSELLLPEGRIDLAIIDIENTVFAVNSKGQNPGFRIQEGNHIFIEIKSSRTSRSSISSKSEWNKLILSDIEKLNKYSNPCHMLCFDYSQILDDEEVSSIRNQTNKNVELHYIKKIGSNSYIETKGT